MPFPVIVSTSVASKVDSNGTSHTHTLPTGWQIVGNKLLAVIAFDAPSGSSMTVTPPANWTELAYTYSTQGYAIGLYTRTIDGSESSERTWTTSANERSACQMWEISGCSSFAVSAASTGGTGSASSLLLEPGLGTIDFLWFSVLGGASTGTVSVFPADYGTTGQTHSNDSPTTGADAHLVWAYRTNTAASEDPGSFTVSDNWTAYTVAAVPEAASVGTGGARGSLLNPGLN
jgi:hypothetical protein